MTIWKPDLSTYAGPRYQAIADALAADMAGGAVAVGDKLPTHRDLAYQLGLTVGTVSRAYAEAERRGLVRGEVGRGTFVRDPGKIGPSFGIRQPSHTGTIDMAMNRPPSGPVGEMLARTLAELSQTEGLTALMEYQPAHGMAAHREAGARLLAESGLDVTPDEVVVTNGVQHAVAACLMALARTGSTVLMEELSYPPIKSLAQRLDLKVKPLAMDGEGIRPDALEAACAKGGHQLLYCMPTVHNPLGVTMGETRRRDIAAIINAHALPFMEDGVYGFMQEDSLPSLTQYAPDYGYFLTSTAKSIAPGLRIGYLGSHARDLASVGHAAQMTGWMSPPLMGEVAARWIIDGTATELFRWHHAEAAARYAIAEDALKGYTFQGHRTSYHLWLTLPDHVRADDVAATCAQRGTAVTAPQSFCVEQVAVPNAVRVCIGSPRTRDDLRTGLGILKESIENPCCLSASIL